MFTLLLDLEGTLLDSRLAAGAEPHEIEHISAHPPKLYPGIAELLAAGQRNALVTLCSRRYTEALLDVTGLRRWLHCSFCADDSGDKADLVKMALRELGRPAFLLGDSPGDLEAAHRHRVTSFGAGWSYAGHDLRAARAVLAHPLDLLAAIK